MDNRNFHNGNENNDGKKKQVSFWHNFGLFFLALGLAILTVVVISLNVK